jgi:hypothetical protein
VWRQAHCDCNLPQDGPAATVAQAFGRVVTPNFRGSMVEKARRRVRKMNADELRLTESGALALYEQAAAEIRRRHRTQQRQVQASRVAQGSGSPSK